MNRVMQQVMICRLAIFAMISLLAIAQYGLASHYDDADLLDVDCNYCIAHAHADDTDITPNVDLSEVPSRRNVKIVSQSAWQAVLGHKSYLSRGPPSVLQL